MATIKPRIGIVGRFFPVHYRPALDEISFLAKHEFGAIQFNGTDQGFNSSFLGASFLTIHEELVSSNIQPTMELTVRIDVFGKTTTNLSISQVLENNLPAITELECNPVHIHVVPPQELSRDERTNLMHICKQQFSVMVRLAEENNFVLGMEHNDPAFPLFGNYASCEEVLSKEPKLKFTWDTNHTTTEELHLFQNWFNRLAVVHVSDSPLPELNYHWSLGRGSIDFAAYLKPLVASNYQGIYILEVGGLPKSGGYGQDTDQALLSSKQHLEEVLKKIYLKQKEDSGEKN